MINHLVDVLTSMLNEFLSNLSL